MPSVEYTVIKTVDIESGVARGLGGLDFFKIVQACAVERLVCCRRVEGRAGMMRDGMK